MPISVVQSSHAQGQGVVGGSENWSVCGGLGGLSGSLTAGNDLLVLVALPDSTTPLTVDLGLTSGLTLNQIFFQTVSTGTYITATSITSNVLTVTAPNSFVAGQSVTLSGTAESFLNSQSVTVLSTGLSNTQFEANFTHADYSNPADTGTAGFSGSLQAFLAQNVSGGASAVLTSLAYQHLKIIGVEVSGLGSTPLDQTSYASGHGTTATVGPVTDSFANDLLASWGGWANTGTALPGVTYDPSALGGPYVFQNFYTGYNNPAQQQLQLHTAAYFQSYTVSTTGPFSMQASILGDTGYWIMGFLTLKGVGLVPTTVSILSSENPSQYEDEVTFTVNVSGALLTSPTGTVGLYDGVNLLATLPLSPVGSGSSSANYVTNSLSPGVHSLTAAYGGDSNFAAQTSSPFLQQVNAVVIVPALLPSFALVASFSALGDVSLPPTAQLFAVPQTASPHQSITLIWDTTNVAAVEITGNNGFDPPFDTGILLTGGSGAFVVGAGFTHTIILTMACFDQHGHLLPVTGQTTVTIT